MTEREIVLKAKKDMSAFEYLYEKYFDQIFRYVMYRVQNRNDAEIIVSNTFYKSMKKLFMFKWKSVPFSAWLYRIAMSEIGNYYRKDKRLGKIKQKIYKEKDAHREEEEVTYKYKFIYKYIKKLPIKYQDIIIFRFFDKKDFSEIADIINKKESTVRVRLHRALKKLKEEIPEEVLKDVYREVS